MNGYVTVLGTDYVILLRNWDDDRKLHDAYAYIEPYTKEIVLRELVPDCMTVKRHEQLREEALRHELVHAFLFESGMTDWCDDEKLVEWIAMQLPKMAAAMQEAGAMPHADG